MIFTTRPRPLFSYANQIPKCVCKIRTKKKNKNKKLVKIRILTKIVGYTMRDIRYKWNEGPNSVGVSSEVSLPQFKVLGHRQRAMEISLTTGTCRRSPIICSHTILSKK